MRASRLTLVSQLGGVVAILATAALAQEPNAQPKPATPQPLTVVGQTPVPPPAAKFEVYYGRRPKDEKDYKVARWGPKSIPSPAYAFRAARAIPVEGEPIENAVMLTKDSKIIAVGRASEVSIPAGYEEIDLGDAWLVPGFVDLHCHMASPSSDINDMVHPTNPEFRTLDLITLEHESIKTALAGGVTTVLYIPGSGTNMGGFGTLTKLHGDPREALVRFPGCLKIAQAGNPERRSGDLGTTPLGMNQGLRFTLERGRDYCKAWEDFEAGKGPKPEVKPDLEYLRGLFLNEYPCAVHTQIYQVMLETLTQLRGEFGLWTIVVHGCFDAYRLAGEALRVGVPICSGPRSYHFDRETSRFMAQAPGFYWGGSYDFQGTVAGVGHEGIAVNTDSPVVPQEQLQLQCAMAVRLGLPDAVGLRALTINPARFIGVDHRLGSLRTGKDADFCAWSGDPIDPRSHVQLSVVNGRIAYRRDPKRPRF